MEQHFDISRIIGIEVRGLHESRYKWLPKKRKTAFFGLIKRNSWHDEGYYSNGDYQECYESGCWDAHAYTADELREYGYIVDEDTRTVYEKPCVTVFLEHDHKIYRRFESDSEASEWVSDLRRRSGKEFEINHV